MSNKQTTDAAPKAPCQKCSEAELHTLNCYFNRSIGSTKRTPVLDSERQGEAVLPATCLKCGLTEPNHSDYGAHDHCPALDELYASAIKPPVECCPVCGHGITWARKHGGYSGPCGAFGASSITCGHRCEFAAPAEDYDSTIDFNRDLGCDCIHPESQHDPVTGKCLSVNPTFGPCPCRAGRPVAVAGDEPEPRSPRLNALLVAIRKIRDRSATLADAQLTATEAIEKYMDSGRGVVAVPSPNEARGPFAAVIDRVPAGSIEISEAEYALLSGETVSQSPAEPAPAILPDGRHAFEQYKKTDYCGVTVNGSARCGYRSNHFIHLSGDVVDDRFVPPAQPQEARLACCCPHPGTGYEYKCDDANVHSRFLSHCPCPCHKDPATPPAQEVAAEGLLPCPKCGDCWALQHRPQRPLPLGEDVTCGRCGFNAPFATWQARTAAGSVPADAEMEQAAIDANADIEKSHRMLDEFYGHDPETVCLEVMSDRLDVLLRDVRGAADALAPFAAMDREGCDLSELACERGTASDLTIITSQNFRDAKVALDNLGNDATPSVDRSADVGSVAAPKSDRWVSESHGLQEGHACISCFVWVPAGNLLVCKCDKASSVDRSAAIREAAKRIMEADTFEAYDDWNEERLTTIITECLEAKEPE